jgi:hypothetical protein
MNVGACCGLCHWKCRWKLNTLKNKIKNSQAGRKTRPRCRFCPKPDRLHSSWVFK